MVTRFGINFGVGGWIIARENELQPPPTSVYMYIQQLLSSLGVGWCAYKVLPSLETEINKSTHKIHH